MYGLLYVSTSADASPQELATQFCFYKASCSQLCRVHSFAEINPPALRRRPKAIGAWRVARGEGEAVPEYGM